MSLEEHWQALLSAAAADSPVNFFVEKIRQRAIDAYAKEVQPLGYEGTPMTEEEIYEVIWKREFLMRRAFYLNEIESEPPEERRKELMVALHALDTFYRGDTDAREGKAAASDVVEAGNIYFAVEETFPNLSQYLLRHYFAEIPDNLFEVLEKLKAPFIGDVPEAQQVAADEEVASERYETRIAQTHVKRTFEKFGMHFEYIVAKETVPRWDPIIDGSDDKSITDWKLGSGEITSEHVVRASVRRVDKPSYAPQLPICVYNTNEGPIIGLQLGTNAGCIELRHPAMLQYTAGRLQLKPIFGADRTLLLRESAVTVETVPTELMLAAYSGFIVQSLMGTFTRPLPKQLHEKEEPLGYTWLGR